MRELSQGIWSDTKLKGLRYWLLAVLFIAAGMVTSRYFATNLLQGARGTVYQFLQRMNPYDIAYGERVVFVAVGDDEFWKGPLDRRIPVKRDYLARLVEVLDAADPAVLAIDYNLRSPESEGRLVETPAYAHETEELIAAVEGSTISTIVLPATLDVYHYDGSAQSYQLDSSIFANHKFLNARVRWGYLNVYPDIGRIPLEVYLRGRQQTVPSFAQQIVAGLSRRSLVAQRARGTILASFIPTSKFFTVSARQVLSDPAGAWRERVQHQAVIIGNFAHEDGDPQSPYIDSFQTPVGEIPGAAVHANYVEALIHNQISQASPEAASLAAELLLSAAVSILLARRIRKLKKAGYFAILSGSAFVVSYFLLQNLAIFFDPVLPVLAVLLHSLCERAFWPHPGSGAPSRLRRRRSAPSRKVVTYGNS